MSRRGREERQKEHKRGVREFARGSAHCAKGAGDREGGRGRGRGIWRCETRENVESSRYAIGKVQTNVASAAPSRPFAMKP